jgi:hypothetical protein
MSEGLSMNKDLLAKRLLDLVRDEANATVYVESYAYVYVRDQDGDGDAEELELVEGFTFASNAEVEAIAKYGLEPLIVTGAGYYDVMVHATGWEADIEVRRENEEPIRARVRFDRGVQYITGTYATIHIQKYGKPNA